MRVLIACEESATVRSAFEAMGHDAWSCDILPSRLPGKHYQCSVFEVLYSHHWDLLIAHPPCTYLTYAGNRYWNDDGRAVKREMAYQFFLRLANAPVKRIALENPVGYPNTMYRKPDQILHPYYFGDPYLKKTCLWLKNLPKLWYWQQDDLFGSRTATDYPEPVYKTYRPDGTVKLRHFAEASHGSTERSKTFPGIAKAMADQWGRLA